MHNQTPSTVPYLNANYATGSITLQLKNDRQLIYNYC